MIIEVECRMCGKQFLLLAKTEDVQKWMDGMLIQDAFPYMPAEERELLISRTCPVCWDKMWKEEEHDR